MLIKKLRRSAHIYASGYRKRWEVKLGGKWLFLLRNLQSFNVDKSTLIMFWISFIETILTFTMICYFYGLNVKSRSQLQTIVNLGSKITGSVQLGLSALSEKNVLRKSLSILDDSSHILYSEFELLTSDRRMPKWRTVRTSTSFVSNAVLTVNTVPIWSIKIWCIFTIFNFISWIQEEMEHNGQIKILLLLLLRLLYKGAPFVPFLLNPASVIC